MVLFKWIVPYFYDDEIQIYFQKIDGPKGVDKVNLPVIEQILIGKPKTFGENFAVRNQTESDVCIGDIFQIGEVKVQVSQPRQPCWKPARRWKVKSLFY